MTCNECKHYETSENYEKHLGWCELRLPVWLHKATNTNQYDVDRTVRKDDSCSFWENGK